MRNFVQLYTSLDATTKTSEKVASLAHYFRHAPADDAAWATFFLCGRRLRQLVPTRLLRQWAAEQAGIQEWLFDESYDAVGDLAETISLVVPPGDDSIAVSLTEWVENRLRPLAAMDELAQREAVTAIWKQTQHPERFVVLKLMTGAFRVGVSARLVTRGIAEAAGVPVEVVAHRLMGNWKPSLSFFKQLTSTEVQDAVVSRPYPFCLAHAIDSEQGPTPIGAVEDYLCEWKWDGIRGQLIQRAGRSFVWSRGEELMEDRWPEIESAMAMLPSGTVLDGEILAQSPGGDVLPFTQLQRRINRKTIGKKLLGEVPVVFHAFDVLEINGLDIRALPLVQRREQLESLVGLIDHPHLQLTELLGAASWDDLARLRATSRDLNAEGLMLKHKHSAYEVGRKRGVWWKWKIEPYTVDAVLIYAQRGHGKRASLYTDYTFAVWDEGQLVPFAKAYSGLDDSEIQQVDRFVRQNTQEKFGPVRSVVPKLVMELAFEGLQLSSRHKSGIAVRFPRIVRWRHDKQPEDADRLADLRAMLGSDPANE